MKQYSNYCTEPLTIQVTKYYRSTGQSFYHNIFDDGNQKDAAEFIQTMIQHAFTEPMNEALFGGITRKIAYCQCGKVEDLQAERMSEVFQLPIVGSSLESCFSSFLEPEEVEKRCQLLQSDKSIIFTVL